MEVGSRAWSCKNVYAALIFSCACFYSTSPQLFSFPSSTPFHSTFPLPHPHRPPLLVRPARNSRHRPGVLKHRQWPLRPRQQPPRLRRLMGEKRHLLYRPARRRSSSACGGLRCISSPYGQRSSCTVPTARLVKARITIPPLSDEYVDSIFGQRMNGIRYRAQGLVAGGHIDAVSCRITEGRLRGTTKKCFIFNCVCSASVMAKGYNVCIVFDDTKKYCEEGSSCKCADGNLFCSHMLAALCLLYIFQLDDSTFDDLLHILPEGVMTIQNIACPWDFLLKLDNFKYKHE